MLSVCCLFLLVPCSFLHIENLFIAECESGFILSESILSSGNLMLLLILLKYMFLTDFFKWSELTFWFICFLTFCSIAKNVLK